MRAKLDVHLSDNDDGWIMGDLLRIITQPSEAIQELNRLKYRTSKQDLPHVTERVRELIQQVRRDGDIALGLSRFRVDGSELDVAYQQISQDRLKAIQGAGRALDRYYQSQLIRSQVKFWENGVTVGKRYAPVQRAAIYLSVTGSSLSQLLRQARAARVAQVAQVVLVVAAEDISQITADILVAAQEAGIEEIYCLKGPQAIAALTYGTASIAPVEVITGLGDSEVTLAKQLLSAWVKTDQPLAQTDVMMVADSTASVSQLALELITQAEQNPSMAQVLMTTNRALAHGVQQWLSQYCQDHPLALSTEKAIAHLAVILVSDHWSESIDWVNQMAPDRLHLWLEDPWPLVEKVRRARTILLNPQTTAAIADYFGGSPLLQGLGAASHFDLSLFLDSTYLLDYSAEAMQQHQSLINFLLGDDQSR